MIGSVLERVQRYYFLPKPYFRNSMIPHQGHNLKIHTGMGDSESTEYILYCTDCDRKIINEFGLMFNDSYENYMKDMSVPQYLTNHIPDDHEDKEELRQNAWVLLEDAEQIQNNQLVPYKQDEDFFDSVNSYDMLELYDELHPELKQLHIEEEE